MKNKIQKIKATGMEREMVSHAILCGNPEGYGSECGRKSYTEAIPGCVFCTKWYGGCAQQRGAKFEVKISPVTFEPGY